MQLEDAERNEISATLDPDFFLTSNLNFRVAGETDFFSPLLGPVPQQSIASIQRLASVVDLCSGRNLKGWQIKNISLRDCLFQSLDCFFLLGGIGGIEKRRNQYTHYGQQQNAPVHWSMLKRPSEQNQNIVIWPLLRFGYQKSADADIPILKEARAEYAKLQ